MKEFIVIMFLILIAFLVKKENYGTVISSVQFPQVINIGYDINISTWLGLNSSGVSGGLGTPQNYDAQLANSTHFTYNMGDLNRMCWGDTTGLCVGFRKNLQVGGGGKVWYLYSSSELPPTGTPTEDQNYISPTLAVVNNGFSIPQFIIVAKSKNPPTTGICSWVKVSHTCVVTPAGQCGTVGKYTDVYNVSNWVPGQCFNTEGNALTGNGTQTVTDGAPCRTPDCPSGYDNGIPGTVVGGVTQTTLTASDATGCQIACTNKTGCKIAQFTPPSTCTGFASKTGVNTGTSSMVYTRP